MKPPVVHQPVQPPQPQPPFDDGGDARQPPNDVAADDVRYESTIRSRPGLVDPAVPDFDIAPDQERRRH